MYHIIIVFQIYQLALLGIVTRNAKRLQRLTEDILDVTRIESRLLKLNDDLFELNGIILNAVQDIIDEIDNVKVKLLYDVKDDIISVETDKGRITQVISNLLKNIIKFTKKGSISINIERKEHNQYVIISVKILEEVSTLKFYLDYFQSMLQNPLNVLVWDQDYSLQKYCRSP
ncbi:MAG TPA: HAMP domain-containing sensor histidine kinase [Nitrososphaeraceae archaeon]|nr:HAMP domain-containing sensor histidine kinase [Nitrososphaeraceae archaeon]